jgi:hypothetical protein
VIPESDRQIREIVAGAAPQKPQGGAATNVPAVGGDPPSGASASPTPEDFRREGREQLLREQAESKARDERIAANRATAEKAGLMAPDHVTLDYGLDPTAFGTALAALPRTLFRSRSIPGTGSTRPAEIFRPTEGEGIDLGAAALADNSVYRTLGSTGAERLARAKALRNR